MGTSGLSLTSRCSRCLSNTNAGRFPSTICGVGVASKTYSVGAPLLQKLPFPSHRPLQVDTSEWNISDGGCGARLYTLLICAANILGICLSVPYHVTPCYSNVGDVS